jgi:hypothetical protein
MRQRDLITLVLVVVFWGTAAAEPKPVDVQAKAKTRPFEVYKDDAGGYVAWPTPKVGSDEEARHLVFAGDAKGMYRQRHISASTEDKGYHIYLWSPFVIGIKDAELRVLDGRDGGVPKTMLVCDDARKERVLTPLPADQAKAFVDGTKFYEELLDRRAYFLGRTDAPLYYYVDWTGEKGAKAWRLFVGKKGAMKPQALTSLDQDSGGVILSTATATLSLKTDGTGTWITGDRRQALVVLPPEPSGVLIYRELGIYGRIGVLCEH